MITSYDEDVDRMNLNENRPFSGLGKYNRDSSMYNKGKLNQF